MAIYRQIHVSFWQDPFILDLTPEEKYFYVYLLSNSKTKQCGCYELPKKVIELETGYNRETVEKLLQRFMAYGKIEYCEETKEILLVNWLKYNSSKSPKVMQCIKKEIQEIKYAPFARKTMHRLSIDLGEEEEKEEEQEQEEEQEESAQGTPAADAAGTLMDAYNEIFGPLWKKPLQLTPKRRKHILARLKKFSSEELIQAMRNMRADPFLIGQHPRNTDGKVYATPEYVFRSDETVEKWLNKKPAGPRGPTNSSRKPQAWEQKHADSVSYDDEELVLRRMLKAARGDLAHGEV
jgi:hypothetical protein